MNVINNAEGGASGVIVLCRFWCQGSINCSTSHRQFWLTSDTNRIGQSAVLWSPPLPAKLCKFGVIAVWFPFVSYLVGNFCWEVCGGRDHSKKAHCPWSSRSKAIAFVLLEENKTHSLFYYPTADKAFLFVLWHRYLKGVQRQLRSKAS